MDADEEDDDDPETHALHRHGGEWYPEWAFDHCEHEFLDKWGYTESYKAWKFAELEIPKGQERQQILDKYQKNNKDCREYWKTELNNQQKFDNMTDLAEIERITCRELLTDLKYAFERIQELEAAEDEEGAHDKELGDDQEVGDTSD